MRTIQLDKRYPGDYKGKRLTDDDYDTILDDDAVVYGPEGEYVCGFKKRAIDMPVVAKAWKVLRDWHPKTDNRGAATGIGKTSRRKKDGTIQKANRVPKGYEVESGVVGFFDRYQRIPYCRPCAWNAEHPQRFEKLLPFFQQVRAAHESLDPDGFGFMREVADRTKGDWLIPETPYTTVTVNKNFRTAAHLDAKNLRDASAAMAYIREGRLKGGLVVFPEWRVAVKMDTSDVIVFRNMVDWHGNTPIVKLGSNTQRCTLVHYYKEGMINCGTPSEELERAKRRTAGDPIQNDHLNPEAEDML